MSGILSDVTVGVKRDPSQEFECPDELLQKALPGVYDALARIRDGGKIRVGASITLKYKDGGCLVCLSAPSEGVVGFHQGSSWENALKGLEQRLQGRTMDWRKRDEK